MWIDRNLKSDGGVDRSGLIQEFGLSVYQHVEAYTVRVLEALNGDAVAVAIAVVEPAVFEADPRDGAEVWTEVTVVEIDPAADGRRPV